MDPFDTNEYDTPAAPSVSSLTGQPARYVPPKNSGVARALSSIPGAGYVADQANQVGEAMDKGQYARAAGRAALGAVTAFPVAAYETYKPIMNAAQEFGRGFLGTPDQPAAAPVSTPQPTARPQTAPAAVPSVGAMAPQLNAPRPGEPGGPLKVVNSIGEDGNPLRTITGSGGQQVPQIAQVAQSRALRAPQVNAVTAPQFGTKGGIFASMLDFNNQLSQYATDKSGNAASVKNFAMQKEAQAANQDAELKGTQISKGNTEAETAKIGLENQKRASGLRQRILNEKDSKARKALENQLYSIIGKPQPKFQVVTQEGVGPDGVTPTKTPYIIDEEGTSRPAIAKPSLAENPAAMAVVNDKGMSRDEKAQKLQAMGYQ